MCWDEAHPNDLSCLGQTIFCVVATFNLTKTHGIFQIAEVCHVHLWSSCHQQVSTSRLVATKQKFSRIKVLHGNNDGRFKAN